ncbi:MAG TPA: carbon-nitrogen hydrolase family protein [Chryseosolibacter sp.]|nr:carbon-nitrogen hydrolase family protein [Chryseosolibacter sp.]
MKICIAQTRPVRGDIAANIAQHERIVGIAISGNCDAVFFPELSLTGYEPELAEKLSIDENDPILDRFQLLADAHNIIIGVGAPTRYNGAIRISMLIFQRGRAREIYSKKYLHPDEEPYFVPGEPFRGRIFSEMKCAIAICYELSVPEHAEAAAANGASLYIASAAKSARGLEHALERLHQIAAKHQMTVLFSNSVGECSGFVSAGTSSIWSGEGILLGHLEGEHEGIMLFDTADNMVTEIRLNHS